MADVAARVPLVYWPCQHCGCPVAVRMDCGELGTDAKAWTYCIACVVVIVASAAARGVRIA